MVHGMIGSTAASNAPRLNRRHVRAALFVVCCMAAVGAMLFFLSLRDADPVAAIPSPVMPAPNAFDYFVRAEKLSNERIGAIAPLVYPNPSLSQERIIAAQNQAALHILRQGLVFPYENPPVRSFDAKMPYYGKFRSLARVLLVDARVKAANGNYRAAAEDDLDAMKMGEMIPHGSVLVGRLVGEACQEIVRRDFWQEASHLDAAGARDYAARLENVEAGRVPLSCTIQQEKWALEAALIERMRPPGWRSRLLGEFVDENPWPSHLDELPLKRYWPMLHLLPYSKQQILDNLNGYMDASAALARLPYSSGLHDPAFPMDPINQSLNTTYGQVRFRDASNTSRNSLLIASLALRAYRLEHGYYPTRLEELVPSYLKRIPADAFAAGQPLRYRRSGTGCVLYSVGPDGRDDGGVPSTKPDPRYSDHRSRIQKDSRGDIVAGIDLY